MARFRTRGVLHRLNQDLPLELVVFPSNFSGFVCDIKW